MQDNTSAPTQPAVFSTPLPPNFQTTTNHTTPQKSKKKPAFITSAILFLCSALLILSPILSSNTSALSATDGTQETLMQKLYIGAIKDAFYIWAKETTKANAIPLDPRLTGPMSGHMLLDGGWRSHVTVTTGVLIEYASQGKLDNGTVWMDGTQGNNFWNAAFTALGIPGTKPIDIICHGVTKGLADYEGARILKPRLVTYSDGSIPGMEYQPECGESLADGRQRWFDAPFNLPNEPLVSTEDNRRKSFAEGAAAQVESFLQANSTAPKAADGSLELKLSELEEYYLYHKVFLSGCVASETPLQDSFNFTDPKYENNNTERPDTDFDFKGSEQNLTGYSANANKFFKIWVVGSSNTPEVQFFKPKLQIKDASSLTSEFEIGNGKKGSCYDIANKLSEGRAQQLGNKLLAAGVQAQNVSAVGPSATSSENVDAKENDNCFNGAPELGWILCPILEMLAASMGYLYDHIITPFLKIDARLFSDESNGVRVAWGAFQSMANIVFIILILIVILSQVTGFGIDNYGIKKILPKLIVTAVLINLSYFICQMAVDLSNITGFGLRELFANISTGVNAQLDGEAVATGIGAGVMTGVVAFIGGAGVVALIASSGAAILLPLIFTLISGVVALLFMFILLGMRQAGVVLLTVVAPLAVICYMLPNTKKIFDRWIKMFTGLLLFFPICGLLIGGGDLASRILLSIDDGGFWMAMVAMLINVIPFFFIPTLLKGSFAAMGNIGAKISNMGSRLSKGANAGIKNSDGYKDFRARTAAGVDSNGNVTKFGQRRLDFANRTKMGRRGLARNRATYLKSQEDIMRANNLTSGNGFDAAMASQRAAAEEQEVKNRMAMISAGPDANNMDSLRKGLEEALLSNDTDGIKAHQNILSAKGDGGRQAVHTAMVNAENTAGGVSAAARKTWATNIMDRHSADYKSNSRDTYEYAKDISDKGTVRDIPGLTNLASYSSAHVGRDKIKGEGLVSMDDAAFARYFGNGEGKHTPAEQAAAYDALHGESATKLDAERRAALTNMSDGYPPAPPDSSSDDSAPNSGNPTPDPTEPPPNP